MAGWIRVVARRIAGLCLTALVGGLLTASMARNSPGFDSDERQLDVRISEQTRTHFAEERAGGRNLIQFYVRHLGGMLRGDFGESPTLRQPVARLIAARLPVTVGVMAAGLAGGWLLALALAVPSVMLRSRAFSRTAEILNVCLLALPASAIAIFVFSAGGPVHAIVGLVLLPRLYEYATNLLRNASAMPHVLAARAKGVPPLRILLKHVLPVCTPEFLALGGISLAMAFGIAIPVETLCDLPGVGQLAWKAATARDLPLLVTLTMGIAMFTQFCNGVADCAGRRYEGARA